MNTNVHRPISTIAIAALFATSIGVQSSFGAAGETALSKCVDRVVAACNKRKDHAVNPCIDSGISQCEKQHKAEIKIPHTPRFQAANDVKVR